jgi:nucleoside-diphosphate-sugar epimerase
MAEEALGLTVGEDALFDVNVRGAHNTARAAAAAGARRFVLLSSSVVYGIRADNPQPLAETADVRASARHFYARHKAQAELLVTRALADAPTDLYVLRTSTVLGPHAAAGAPAGTGSALRALARAGLRPAVPVPPVPLQFVHEEDVAQAIVLAIQGAGDPDVYNLAAEDVVGGHEALERLGVRPLPVPRVLVEAGLRAAVAAPQIVPAAGWPEVLTEPLLTDAGKARRELGWEPHYSSRAALDATRRAIGW